MATAKEYRQFAEECFRWADEAKTEQDRTAFLELARVWTLAALRLEASTKLKRPRRSPQQQHPSPHP